MFVCKTCGLMLCEAIVCVFMCKACAVILCVAIAVCLCAKRVD